MRSGDGSRRRASAGAALSLASVALMVVGLLAPGAGAAVPSRADAGRTAGYRVTLERSLAEVASPKGTTPRLELTRVSPADGVVVVGDWLTVGGKLRNALPPNGRKRLVALQIKQGKSWKRLSSTRVSTSKVLIVHPAPEKVGRAQLRLVAPAMKDGRGGKLEKLVSKTASVRIRTNLFPVTVLSAFPRTDRITDVAVDSAGTVYVSGLFPEYRGPNITVSPINHHPQILRLDPGGTWTAIAGNGDYGNPVPGPALSSPLSTLTSLDVAPNGDVYAYTRNLGIRNDRCSGARGCAAYVVRISAGQLSIAAGNGLHEYYYDEGDPRNSPLGGVAGLAVGPSGDVFLAVAGTKSRRPLIPASNASIARISADGSTLSTFREFPSCSPDAVSASGSIVGTDGLVMTSSGRILLHRLCGQNVIVDVTTPGVVTPVAGNPSASPGTFVPGPATSTGIPNEGGVFDFGFAATSAGDLVIPGGWQGLEWVTGAGAATLHRAIAEGWTASGYLHPQHFSLGDNAELYMLADLGDPARGVRCQTRTPKPWDNGCVLLARVGMP